MKKKRRRKAVARGRLARVFTVAAVGGRAKVVNRSGDTTGAGLLR